MFLLIVKCSGQGIACATAERIKGCIAHADDTVIQNCDEVLINTRFPAEFVTRFYGDGFDNNTEIQLCEE